MVAAGRGERLGTEHPKAFAKLGGRPLLAESLERLDACERIEAIVAVAPAGWEEPVILLAEELGAGKVAASIAGGETRDASVRAGLGEVPPDAPVVLVHDAARPLLPSDVVERVLAPLGDGWDGAVAALPVADTLKRARDGRIVATLDRSDLHLAQTPQAFGADVLRRALARGATAGTDCATYVESAGGSVQLVPGDPRLVKITTTADLAFVERLLTAGR